MFWCQASLPAGRRAGGAWHPRAVPLDSGVVLAYAGRTVWALVVAVVALLVAALAGALTRSALRRHRAHANATILIGNLAQAAIVLFGILGVLAIYTGDSFGWILASFSVVGVVLGLSLQDILKNFFAGLWVLVERPFRIGDRIGVSGQRGVVEDIAFRTTLLRSEDGDELIIPNGMFMTATVTNYGTRVPSGTKPAGEQTDG